MDWVFYTVVGLAVGLNLGYMIGVRRGASIVGMLLDGIGRVATGVSDMKKE